MEKMKVVNGVYWVDIPEAGLYVLCGCPADTTKHLMKRGFIVQKVKQGVTYESGPNVILLSDVSIQKGAFSNLAEFPILQMLYRQGMILPDHPNNTGDRPMLAGLLNQITAQSEYIYRGNYGLTSVEEIMEAGISRDVAEEIFRIKLKFAFGKIKKTEELLDFRIVETDPVELKNGVFIQRKELNVYEFQYKGGSLVVDMNLGLNEEYEPAINLDFHKINREYFSVIHIGEGNGWDVNRQCMSSLVTFQGKIYLIDTGPNILHSLTALGISVNEINGIFHTHAHDDHFAGLPSLVRTDHQIKYYATPLVRSTVIKKLSALMSISEKRSQSSFAVYDLKFNKWNNINGLEVMPIYSPHPVETSIFFFRTLWEGGYRTYAHFADIPSMETMDNVLFKEIEESSFSKKIYMNVKTSLFKKVNLKKIDIGGGLIHGKAEDFANDRSSKIVLSHISESLTDSQKEIGSNASFGMEDVLISAHKDYHMLSAFRYLSAYFPDAPRYELNMLLNCPVVSFNVGLIIAKKGIMNKYVYCLLSGVIEVIDSAAKTVNRLSAGSIIGELAVVTGEAPVKTYRAMSYISVLQIPCALYEEFIKRNFTREQIRKDYENKKFLESSWLFGEMVSSVIQSSIARQMEIKFYPKDVFIDIGSHCRIFMLKAGRVRLELDDKPVDMVAPGGFFGEESIFYDQVSLMTAFTMEDCEVYIISGEVLRKIPIIEWKMLETFERRLTAFGTQLDS
ncbi:MAG: cyclic nucleotide-binding domain-containing protein [Spirochaetales bacterium]|nr:cyclic nucleotide-binding domain-containing protein [Spirochaetales bacterium]